ncbi:MAG: hypothetical protein FD176_1743 [Rhodospirillaceae bacterium]|nr:MAG: hypothetical protein FD176_1743 [Rhodospirillaceae bacterium]TNC96271.1 MAG: Uncharacterized protein FD119_1871 [Stygiobacter sp.]
MTESEKPEPTEGNTVAAEIPTQSIDAGVTDAGVTDVGATDVGATDNAPAKSKSAPWLALGASASLIAVVVAGVASFDHWKDLVLPARTQAPVPMVASSPVNTAPAPTFRPASEADGLRVELNALRDRLGQVESRATSADLAPRLGKAEAAIQALQALPQVPPTLVAEVGELSRQVVELRRTSADAAAVLRLADRVEKAEAEMRELQAKRSSAVAQLLAVGQLREALARAMPYDNELRALLALAGADPEVVSVTQPLKARAITGIPTAPTLIGRFHRLAPDLVRAQVLPAEQSWWRQTLDRLTSLVTVRREDGEAAGDSAAAIVARVEARLAEDDLEHAAAEAVGLKDAAAEIAAPWLADVQARLAADKAASALTAHVVAQVGARQ